jgi:hypothetical protein
MFDWLKAIYFKKAMAEALAQNPAVERMKLPLAQIKTVGILFNGPEERYYPQIEAFAKALGSDRQVDFLAYIPVSQKKLGVRNMPYTFFLNNLVNWFGIPSGLKIDQFMNKRFDLLLYLCDEPMPTLEYMMALSKSKCRMGRYTAGKEYCYDLMVNVPETATVPELIYAVQYALQQVNHN